MSRYSGFFPPDLRAAPPRESRPWRDLDVSLVRAQARDAPLSCIVLHGGGGNAELVAPIVAAIARAGYDALAPDLPGYGRTDVPRRRFRYETWVELVRDLAIAEAGPERRPVAVFGLSMGGMLGYHAACDSAAISGVAATNLLDVADPGVRRVAARNRLMAAAIPLLIPPLDPIAVPIRWLSKMDRIANDPELARACATDPRGGGSRVPLRFLRSWLHYRAECEPEQFDRPVLLAHPGDDRWTPTDVSLPFFERLAGSKRLVVLERCGHAPLEQPGLDTLREELKRFLGELVAAPHADRRAVTAR